MVRWLGAKKLGAIRPVDDIGREALQHYPDDAVFWVDTKRPRNLRHHRLYWKLIEVVHENLEAELFPTKEELHEAVKIMTGLRRRIWLPPGSPLDWHEDGRIKARVGPDGLFVYRPLSISFERMGQDEFSAYYERVADLLARWFLPGVTSAELRREVEAMILPSTSYHSSRTRKAKYVDRSA
jgi:hypothetical protein